MLMWNPSWSDGAPIIQVLNAYGSAFGPGEVFNWVVWDASTDLVDPDGAYYAADAVYDEVNYDETGEFVITGLSGLLDLIARTVYIQEISLQEGWGLYSTFISPEDGSLETVLGELLGDSELAENAFGSAITYPNSELIIMKDENGNVFWPLLGMNFIEGLSDGEAYQIKMGSSYTLEVSGELVPSDFELYTAEGWSYIGYLHQDPFDAVDMMSPLSESLIILKNGVGSVYWPLIQVNGIGLMQPGEGYQIKVSNDATFSYPSAEESSRFSPSATPIYPLVKFAESTNTGSNMTIGIPLEAWNVLPEEGDEIAAYSESGMLVGSVTYTGNATALTVWGDDITTDGVDGLLEGEEVSFELWRKSEDKIEELKIERWVEGNSVYSINGIAIAGDISSMISGMGYALYPNVPNPFNTETSISFFTPADGEIKIGVYDMLGNLVKEITNDDYKPGMYMLEFSAEGVAPGTYFVRMTAAGFMVTNTINIIK